jgi:hypothetical protein
LLGEGDGEAKTVWISGRSLWEPYDDEGLVSAE